MKLTAQQEKFEAWLKTIHPRGKDENGEYIDDLVWNMFEAWKASQAQRAHGITQEKQG